jgi:hypothetical protein
MRNPVGDDERMTLRKRKAPVPTRSLRSVSIIQSNRVGLLVQTAPDRPEERFPWVSHAGI